MISDEILKKSFRVDKQKKLFIFEIANNHNGSILNGFKLIDSAKKISKSNKVNFAVKLQFRDLRTFIYKKKKKLKINI